MLTRQHLRTGCYSSHNTGSVCFARVCTHLSAGTSKPVSSSHFCRQPERLRRYDSTRCRVATPEAPGYGRTNMNKSDATSGNKPCSCGSGQKYKDCCAEYHNGAWAHTAVDLARARISAHIMGLEDFLADSTHPESMDLIGGRLQFARKKASRIRWYKQSQPKLRDICHDQAYQEEDAWIVAYALRCTDMHGEPKLRIFADKYVKQNGKWVFWSDDPTQIQYYTASAVGDFFEKYSPENRESWTDDVEDFPFSFSFINPRQSASQMRWLVDAWPEKGQSVYMDDMGQSEEVMRLIAADRSAKEDAEQFMKAMMDPELQQQTYYFRHGRFRYN